MHLHHAVYFLAAALPILIGFVWYSKPLFGDHWVNAASFRDGGVPPARMGLIVLFTYILSLMLSLVLSAIVIHQMTLGSIVQKQLLNPATKVMAQQWLDDSMARYGAEFRTFKHGALHGTIISIFFALPVMGIIALYERKSFKYVAVHTGYWILTLALMGGVLCQWL